MKKDVYILSATRTPIGSFTGSLSSVPVEELGVTTAEASLDRSGVSREDVEEVIFGNVLTAGVGQAPARQVQLGAGVPAQAGALTINKVCGSGLKAIVLGAQAILLEDHDVVLTGGMENMSRAPYLIPELRDGFNMGDGDLVDSMIHDGLWDSFNDIHMGETAERVAEKYSISRKDQDKFAYNSHKKAVEAQENGYFDEEIVSVSAGRNGEVTEDERPRPDTSVESLGELSPAFRRDGTVTPGNASGINDGASSLVLASEEVVEEEHLEPLGRITGYATGGVEPEWVMEAPLPTIDNHLEKNNLTLDEFDLIEINEAFSAQGVMLLDELDIHPEQFNVHGGAVALGHPIGCTGARIVTTLLHALHTHGEQTGLAALCLGGGNGVSLSVEAIS